MQNVIVPLNAFDSFEVFENGQASFIELIAQSGAFGVEIRRELLRPNNQELETIRNETLKHSLFTVYSAPIMLWTEGHRFNKEEMAEVFQEGAVLGANWLKVSLGLYNEMKSNIREFICFLKQHQEIQLLIENDQTIQGGNISNLQTFFENAANEHIPVKMTFDAGNWFYSGENVGTALEKLSPYVVYLHLKQVEKGPVTVPLQKEGNDSWQKVMKHFPAEMVKALEFPIEPKEKVADYIRLVTELAKGSEVLL